MTKRKLPLPAMALLLLACAGTAICAEAVQLPEPAKSGGVSLAQALADRSSSREFADADLSPQQLSDLLWSVAGVNRTGGKKVYPVAQNRQDMTAYAVTRQGVYRYDPATNTLVLLVAGDHRAKTGSQPFVASPAVTLAYVQDMALWNESPETRERGRNWGFVHAGEMTQNAYLFAAGQGWSAVVRGMFDQGAMRELLGLSDSQVVRLVHSIGPGK